MTIIERGSLESAENSDIIVRIKAGAKGSVNASTIKWVIDDGSQVKAGDKIVTNGGIRGVIFSVKDDALVIRVAPDNIKLEVTRQAIASVITEENPKS